MDAETAYVVGKYVGATAACFLVPLIAAIVASRFRRPALGIAAGTLAGGAINLAPTFLMVLA